VIVVVGGPQHETHGHALSLVTPQPWEVPVWPAYFTGKELRPKGREAHALKARLRHSPT
jgi:hypothetical protein